MNIFCQPIYSPDLLLYPRASPLRPIAPRRRRPADAAAHRHRHRRAPHDAGHHGDQLRGHRQARWCRRWHRLPSLPGRRTAPRRLRRDRHGTPRTARPATARRAHGRRPLSPRTPTANRRRGLRHLRARRRRHRSDPPRARAPAAARGRPPPGRARRWPRSSRSASKIASPTPRLASYARCSTSTPGAPCATKASRTRRRCRPRQACSTDGWAPAPDRRRSPISSNGPGPRAHAHRALGKPRAIPDHGRYLGVKSRCRNENPHGGTHRKRAGSLRHEARRR